MHYKLVVVGSNPTLPKLTGDSSVGRARKTSLHFLPMNFLYE